MKPLYIRHVPDDVHQILKVRATTAGMSLSAYALRQLREFADEPTRDELLERLRSRQRPDLPESAADAVRAGRDSDWPIDRRES